MSFFFFSDPQSGWHCCSGCSNCFLYTLSFATEIFHKLPSQLITGNTRPLLPQTTRKFGLFLLTGYLTVIFVLLFFFRRLFSIASYFFFFYNIVLGVLASAFRIIKAISLGFALLPRIDRTSLAMGFQKLDHGMFIDHSFNNIKNYIYSGQYKSSSSSSSSSSFSFRLSSFKVTVSCTPFPHLFWQFAFNTLKRTVRFDGIFVQ